TRYPDHPLGSSRRTRRSRSGAASSPRNHHLEIVPGDDEAVAATPVRSFKQVEDLGLQCSRLVGVKRREHAVGWTIERAKDLQPMLWRLIAEGEGLLRDVD